MQTDSNSDSKRTINWKKYILRKLVFVALFGVLVFIVLRSSKEKDSEEIIGQFCFFTTMNTRASITFYSSDEKSFDSAFDAVQFEFHKVEKLCNIFDPESELSKLNASAFEKPFECSPELWEILSESRRYYEISEGAFDITVTPLLKLWGFHSKRGSIPDAEEIAVALKLVGLEKVVFDDSARTVRFTLDGMSFDLGGIAKGWALDKAAIVTKNIGMNQGFIDLGGNVLCLEKAPPEKKAYKVGIRNPFKSDEHFTTIDMLNEAVATSGNYERYVVIDGKNYTHVMDPRTGCPVENMLSVSIVAPTGIETDAYSTGIFINGVQFAEKLVKNNPKLKILIVSRDYNAPGGLKIDHFGTGWNIGNLILPEKKTE